MDLERGLLLRPSVRLLTGAAGATVGLTVLYFNLGFDDFTFDAVFRVGGPWSLSFHDFLLNRVNPLAYSFDPVLDRLQSSPERSDLTPAYALVAAAGALVVARALWLWRSLGALRGIVCSLVVAAWAGYMALFSVALFFWLANLMNFWLLLPLTYLVHLGRNTQLGSARVSDLAFGSYGAHADEHHLDALESDLDEGEEAEGAGGHGGHGSDHDGHGGGHGHDAGHGQPKGADDVHPLNPS